MSARFARQCTAPWPATRGGVFGPPTSCSAFASSAFAAPGRNASARAKTARCVIAGRIAWGVEVASRTAGSSIRSSRLSLAQPRRATPKAHIRLRVNMMTKRPG